MRNIYLRLKEIKMTGQQTQLQIYMTLNTSIMVRVDKNGNKVNVLKKLLSAKLESAHTDFTK